MTITRRKVNPTRLKNASSLLVKSPSPRCELESTILSSSTQSTHGESKQSSPLKSPLRRTQSASSAFRSNDEEFEAFLLEVNKLEKKIKAFPYDQLRAVSVSDSGITRTYASPQAVGALFNMFVGTFFYADKENRLSYLQRFTQSLPLKPELSAEIDTVFQLARMLLDFKQEIHETEKAYFKNKGSSSDLEAGVTPDQLAQMRKGSNWVLYFLYPVGQFLDKIINPETENAFSQNEYGQCLQNIQKLWNTTYSWLAKNAPERLKMLSGFEPGDGSSKQLTKITPTHFRSKKKLVFSKSTSQEGEPADDLSLPSTEKAGPPRRAKMRLLELLSESTPSRSERQLTEPSITKECVRGKSKRQLVESSTVGDGMRKRRLFFSSSPTQLLETDKGLQTPCLLFPSLSAKLPKAENRLQSKSLLFPLDAPENQKKPEEHLSRFSAFGAETTPESSPPGALPSTISQMKSVFS